MSSIINVLYTKIDSSLLINFILVSQMKRGGIAIL